MNPLIGDPHDDMHQPGSWFSTFLFVVIFLFGVISLNIYGDLSSDKGRSLAVDQFIVLILATCSLIYIFNIKNTLIQDQSIFIISILFIWFMISSVLIDDISTSLRRLFVTFLFCTIAYTLLLLPRDSQHFSKILAISVSIVLGMCYFGVLVLPARSIHQASDAVEPALAGGWRGVFEHKNIAAPAMVILIFFSLYLASRWSIVVGWLLVVLAAVFLFQTNGKSAMGFFPLALVMAAILVRWPRGGAFFFILLIIILNVFTIGAAFSPAIKNFVAGLGLDPTFTSRTDVWALAIGAIMERPFLGHGFNSFWQTEQLLESSMASETWAVTASHAHNSYVEAALDGGLPALLLACIWLVLLPLRDIGRAQRRAAEPKLTLLYTRIWVFAVILATFESNFLKPAGMMWFVLLMAVFGLRLQARADLVDDATTGHERSGETSRA